MAAGTGVDIPVAEIVPAAVALAAANPVADSAAARAVVATTAVEGAAVVATAAEEEVATPAAVAVDMTEEVDTAVAVAVDTADAPIAPTVPPNLPHVANPPAPTSLPLRSQEARNSEDACSRPPLGALPPYCGCAPRQFWRRIKPAWNNSSSRQACASTCADASVTPADWRRKSFVCGIDALRSREMKPACARA